MFRNVLLTSTALALSPTFSFAATCTGIGTTSILCQAPSFFDPFVSNDASTTATIEAGATVSTSAADGIAIDMTGDDAEVINFGTIESTDTGNGGYAITGAGAPSLTGDGLAITNANSGVIRSGDRAIEMVDGSDLRVVNAGLIESRRQAIRSGEPGAYVENAGTVRATEGRAVQLRGTGATLVNSGALIGGEEVVEARGDFTLTNSGTIGLIDESIEDEDGVQFAGGTVHNSGTIRGTDDGIDIDEGTITNTATGQIVSVMGEGSGVDVDEVYDDGDVERQNGTVTILNQGLIEGWQAVGTAEDASNSIVFENAGTLRGRSGVAVRLDPNQGDSRIEILAGSEIFGDVWFGSGDDTVQVLAGFSGQLINSAFDGNEGIDTLVLDDFGIGDVTRFGFDGSQYWLMADNGSAQISGDFKDFELWRFQDKTVTTAELTAVAPVPLPAGVFLLGGALGVLALRRRKR